MWLQTNSAGGHSTGFCSIYAVRAVRLCVHVCLWLFRLKLMNFSWAARRSPTRVLCIKTETRKGGSCEALQLEGRPTPCQSFWDLILRCPKCTSLHSPVYIFRTSATYTLDPATPIYPQVWIFWRLMGIYQYFRLYFQCVYMCRNYYFRASALRSFLPNPN